jgi:hypothetical protein
VNATSSIGGGLSLVSSLGGGIAIVWVVATVVRRQRPDAYRPLLAWAIASLVMMAFSYLLYPALSVLVVTRGGGTEAYLEAIGIWHVISSAIHVGLVVLLVRGLVALAQPPKAVKVESDAPYR